jgi:hypothetical protein
MRSLPYQLIKLGVIHFMIYLIFSIRFHLTTLKFVCSVFTVIGTHWFYIHRKERVFEIN